MKSNYKIISPVVLFVIVIGGMLMNADIFTADNAGGIKIETRLLDADGINKFPSIAIDHDGLRWVAWSSMRDYKDGIYVRVHEGTVWENDLPVSTKMEAETDPEIVVDNDNWAWVIWAGQRLGNWDLYARKYQRLYNLEEMRLTTQIGEDMNPAVTLDENGNIWLAWERKQSDSFEIAVMYYDRENWSEPVIISDRNYNNFRPDIVSDQKGNIYVVWDELKGISHEIALKKFDGKNWLEKVSVTNSGYLNQRPACDVDAEGNLWIVWEGQPDWGENHRIFMACYKNDEIVYPYQIPDKEPEIRNRRTGGTQQIPQTVLPGQVTRMVGSCIFSDISIDRKRGKIWVFWSMKVATHTLDLYGRYYQGNQWSEPVEFVIGEGMCHDEWVSSQVQEETGEVHLVWQGQMTRRIQNPDINIHYARASVVPSSDSYIAPEIQRMNVEKNQVTTSLEWNQFERQSIEYNGETYKVYWCYFHGHSELDDGCGSVDQYYTYAREIAKLDAAAITTHTESEIILRSEYRYTQAMASLFNDPGKFLAFCGFEWSSPSKLYGHKHVIYPTDDQPIFWTVDPETYHPADLLEKVAGTNGVAIPHHIARGGDGKGGINKRNWWGLWNIDYHNPYSQSVVEICQHRGLFEYYNNPYKHRQEALVKGHTAQAALARGYRFGFVGGGDQHFGTPGGARSDGFGAVFAKNLTRKEIVEALHKRRCFATSGARTFLDVRVDGHLMGEEYKAQGSPTLTAKVVGENAVAKIEVVKFKTGFSVPFPVVHTEKPGKKEFSFTWTDTEFDGETGYYIRVTQEDGLVAWSSPVWAK